MFSFHPNLFSFNILLIVFVEQLLLKTKIIYISDKYPFHFKLCSQTSALEYLY